MCNNKLLTEGQCYVFCLFVSGSSSTGGGGAAAGFCTAAGAGSGGGAAGGLGRVVGGACTGGARGGGGRADNGGAGGRAGGGRGAGGGMPGGRGQPALIGGGIGDGATPAGAAGKGASAGVLPLPGCADEPPALLGPSFGSADGGVTPVASPIAVVSSAVLLPKTSGRVPARRVRLSMISVSVAFVVSFIFDSIASRWSFHFGSIKLMRMCSCISASGTNSPVIGDTAYLEGSYSSPASDLL
jgi:hypothetical protein